MNDHDLVAYTREALKTIINSKDSDYTALCKCAKIMKEYEGVEQAAGKLTKLVMPYNVA